MKILSCQRIFIFLVTLFFFQGNVNCATVDREEELSVKNYSRSTVSLSQFDVTQNLSSSVIPPVAAHSINVPPVTAPRRGWLSNIDIYPEDILDCCKCVILGGGASLIVGGFYSLPPLFAGISNISRNLKYASLYIDLGFGGMRAANGLLKCRVNLSSSLTWLGSSTLMFAAGYYASSYLANSQDSNRLLNIGLTVPATILGIIGDCFYSEYRRTHPNTEEN